MADTQASLSEKDELWEQKRNEIDRITDGRGKKIDAGIKETVIVLQLLGMHTRQSCEGHVAWGVCAPWVDIVASQSPELEMLEREKQAAFQDAENLEENDSSHEEVSLLYARAHELRRRLKRTYLQELTNIVPYLEEFYANRQVPFDRRLILSLFANGRIGRVQSQGAEFQETLADDIRGQKLAEYQQEMREFTAFLKEKFFAEDRQERK